MLLYVWIDKFNNLKNIGFNLTSKYNFEFTLTKEAKPMAGVLIAKEQPAHGLFDEYFWDIKAIIGKNGSGKSSMIFSTLQSILTDYPKYFKGFIVTDKFIINRSGINITQDVSIDGLKLQEIKNAEICNYEKLDFQRKLTEKEAANQAGYRVIDTYLNGYSIFYYSPLINYDRISEADSVVAGNSFWQVDYHRFFDISTESQIVADYNALSPYEYMDLKSESEILSHKSMEAERILNYLLRSPELPFKVSIPYLNVHLNQFQVNYWEIVSRHLKQDNQTLGPIMQKLFSVTEKKSQQGGWKDFKNELLKRILLFLLRYEVDHRYNFGDYGHSNALIFTITFFDTISKGYNTFEGIIKNYLSKSEVFKDNFPTLFSQIQQYLKFLYKEHKKGTIDISAYAFDVLFTEKTFISEFLKFNYSFHGYNTRALPENKPEKIKIQFPIFIYDFQGLSAGEKSYLHMLSRFSHYFKLLNPNTKEVVIFLDEPEIAFHPQWQKQFITIITKFFKTELKGRRVQIILTGHSPIIISDLPSSNILFLDINNETKRPYISKLSNIDNTFASNIHALYADAFFIQDGTIGDFAKATIQNTIDNLKLVKHEARKPIETIISLIGDKLIKQRMEELYMEKFQSFPESLSERIERLERELEEAKSLLS